MTFENMAYLSSSKERRADLRATMTRLGIDRDAMAALYDSRTLGNIAHHYQISVADVYIMIGLHEIPLRGRDVNPGVKPAPWPEDAIDTSELPQESDYAAESSEVGSGADPSGQDVLRLALATMEMRWGVAQARAVEIRDEISQLTLEASNVKYEIERLNAAIDAMKGLM